MLIQNLPVADVCRLEQSSFVKGMDMEHIWATLIRENVLPQLPFLRREHNPVSTKDDYFSALCGIILNRKLYARDFDVLSCLFSVKVCLGIEDWSEIAHPFCQQVAVRDYEIHGQTLRIPPRYNEYFTSEQFSNIGIIRLILDASCYYFPKSLTLVCESFAENFFSQEWISPENLRMLTTYLHQIRRLSLDFSFGNPNRVDMLSALPFILNVLSNNGKLQLEDFSVRDKSGQFTENTVFAISPYLKGGEGSCQTLETVSLLTTSSSSDCKVTISQFSEPATLELLDIINNQIQLRKVELCAHRCYGLSCIRLCSALANLFEQPQFREMHLGLSGMLAGSFQELLSSYLTAPCSGDLSLCLQKMHCFTNDMSRFSHTLFCLNIPEENILHKSLTMSSLKLPDAVCVWIREHVHLRLNELKVVSPSFALTTVLLNHPRLEIKRFTLIVNPRECAALLQSPQCFDNVLGSVHLRNFKIDFSNYGWKAEYLMALVSGLHKQAQVGKLELLDISSNKWELLTEAELTQLFQAIFSLPQLETFTLLISNICYFTEQHIQLLCKCWREIAGGKQLKKVRIVPTASIMLKQSGFKVDTVFTEKIAKELVTTDKWLASYR